jgi:hypothetical protein
MDQTPVWKVRFPYAPGGTQDYEVRQAEKRMSDSVFRPSSLMLRRSIILTRRSRLVGCFLASLLASMSLLAWWVGEKGR